MTQSCRPMYVATERAIDIMGSAKSLVYQSGRNTKTVGPFTYGQSVSTECEPYVAPCVATVDCCGCPLPVIRSITTGIYLTIQLCASKWGHADIRKKMFKGVPSFADPDSSATIARVIDLLRIVAAIHHSTPDTINVRSGKSVSTVIRVFTSQATAAFTSAISKTCLGYWLSSVARASTLTQPINGVMKFFVERDHCPATIFMTS